MHTLSESKGPADAIEDAAAGAGGEPRALRLPALDDAAKARGLGGERPAHLPALHRVLGQHRKPQIAGKRLPITTEQDRSPPPSIPKNPRLSRILLRRDRW